ncbi:chromosome segregation protein SMC [Anaeromicrobium sediminis]|uniref:chromosome segregation protein SMC n=1 Tax=Anaeromicrobium sediminis TaxID=1478221 RepID=UPI00159594CD|nr:chromosome segregation protein SMC [Anaeromicrobium sediminis]
MHLRKIELRGFKSFADKTEIKFKDGITAIVGPNGSGKSNISDAVRWVLGEQSAKTLRGSKMEDIIFAGTTNRKPLGMAEVSLTLDNESNKLDVDYSEVTVTRRVYRSGDSEYYINKSLCRLKDIKEIFMDTGVGIDGYSIIGQGKIDEILSNKTGDRRLLFEEAAGIVKYRTRKQESERKLENTEQNLTRVDDIISELENRIPSLERQSKKAKEYIKYKEELRDIEINLYLNDFESIKGDLDSLKEQQRIVLEQLEFYMDKKRGVNTEFEKLKGGMDNSENAINNLKNNIFNISNLIEKREGETKLNHEKKTNIIQNLERIHEEIENIKNNKRNIEEEVKRIEIERKTNKEVLEEERSNILNREKSLKELIDNITSYEENMETYKDDLIEILNLIASKKSEISSLDTLKRNLEKRNVTIEDEKKELSKTERELKEEANVILEESNAIKNKLSGLKKEYHNSSNEMAITKKSYESCIMKENQSLQNIRDYETKKKLLVEMQRAYEGFSRSVKETLKFCKGSALGKNVHGVVGELLKVPKGLEVAVEVTLGATMQNIVCDTPKNAKDIIDYLKKNNLGRVTFLPIENFNMDKQRKRDNISISKNILGYASDLVEFSEEYDGVMKFLLGRTIIVDTIETGIELSKKISKKYKIVSLEGDVINTTGAITGGSYKSKTLNILSRQREIDELEEYLDNENKVKEEIKKEKKQIVEKMNELEVLVDEYGNNIKVTEMELIKINNKIEKNKYEIKNSNIQIEKVNNEIKQIEVDLKETQVEIKLREEEIKSLKLKEESINKGANKNKDEHDKIKVQKDQLNDEITTLKVSMAALVEKDKNYTKSREELSRELVKSQGSMEIKVKNIHEMEAEKVNIEELLIKINTEIKENIILKSQYEINLKKEIENKENISNLYNRLSEDLKKNEQVIGELQDSNHKVELRLARLDIQQQSILSKLLEEYELEYEEAKEYKNDKINIGEASKEGKILRRKIKALGNINMDSIDEYDTVMGRYEFLTTQKDDLTNSIKSLKQVIKDMENTMESQFIKTLNEIRVNFDEIFKSLFGGGKAEIILIDKENILSSKIEIIAQPPGKKLQNLSLLSGGEKALTAISLLFAILRVKPTPFCILDEIEAALDEANVYRYAEFLKEFSSDTQFIVVTHRKGTMESVDALYGVTMEDQGVSKLVSLEMKEKIS